jgi:hypothetical protein
MILFHCISLFHHFVNPRILLFLEDLERILKFGISYHLVSKVFACTILLLNKINVPVTFGVLRTYLTVLFGVVESLVVHDIKGDRVNTLFSHPFKAFRCLDLCGHII